MILAGQIRLGSSVIIDYDTEKDEITFAEEDSVDDPVSEPA